jgi:Dullard-like phosphatase family protein
MDCRRESVSKPSYRLGVPGRKILLLDLDNTVVVACATAELPTVSPLLRIGTSILADRMYVIFRPHCEFFIRHVARFADIVVWTAGEKAYAEAIVEHLFPKDISPVRVLDRSYCSIDSQGNFYKDLNLFSKAANRSLRDVVILDDNVITCAFNSENSTYITPWWGEQDDMELLKAAVLVESLCKQNDVRLADRTLAGVDPMLVFDAWTSQPLY